MNGYSFSATQDYARCPMLFWYRHRVKIERKIKNVRLFLGTLVHEGLMEAFLTLKRTGCTLEEAWEAAKIRIDNLAEEWGEAEYRFDDEIAEADNLAYEAKSLVRRYLYHYGEHQDWEILHVEEEFLTTLSNGQVLTFTPDLVVRAPDGVWIVDHKTTSSLPDGGLPFEDLQSAFYMKGVQSLYPDLQGFIFNYIRKKIPVQPRLNKRASPDGIVHVNDFNRLDTDFQTLFTFLQEEAPHLLSMDMYQRRLAELKDTDRFFWRDTIRLDQNMIDGILEDTAYRVEQIRHSDEAGRYPRTLMKAGYDPCSRCQYQRLCQAELLDWNVDLILEEDYEPRRPKNPYIAEGEDE